MTHYPDIDSVWAAFKRPRRDWLFEPWSEAGFPGLPAMGTGFRHRIGFLKRYGVSRE